MMLNHRSEGCGRSPRGARIGPRGRRRRPRVQKHVRDSASDVGTYWDGVWELQYAQNLLGQKMCN